ncbi:MAG: ABC transporter ATP-binding protein [Eubacteriales bacterium]|nr:ABC transporter ATP-binding protein [Eubacteriales bacterium]
MKQALELKKVSKKYEGFLLDQIDIELPRGCIMGLIGENGAGKSTTIKLILDLISRDNGTIMVLGGDNLENLKAIKENIGVVLDESCFPENLNLWDINRIMKNIYLTWNEKLFWDYTTRFALPSDKKTVKEYSHGMKMKLAIAIALSHDSKLLLLDEATSGLDPVARDEILDVFREFIQDEERSILLSSHITSDLEKICDYITFLHKGKVVFSEQKDDLLEKYGVLKCSAEEFAKIDSSAVKGCRMNEFGVQALVEKQKMNNSYVIDRAGLEDIMLYHIKEK